MYLVKLILSTIPFTISMLLLTAIVGRKQRSRNLKLYLLLASNSIFTIFAIVYSFYRYPDLVLFILTMVILDAIVLNKIFLGENPNQQTYNAWHDDPANWKARVFYYNPKDKRLFPPKKIESFGWTVNFANPYSVIAFIGIMLLALVIIKILN